MLSTAPRAEDTDRREQAGVPATVKFATKPALATKIITRALDVGVSARRVAGDEVYGADPKLRNALEDRGVGYVLAVACSHQVCTGVGKIRADELAARLPRKAWQRLSAGDGSKGPRFYDWAWISIEPERSDALGQRWLLVRRNNTTGELAYYRCWSPTPVPLCELVRVAGRRWTIEESFQASKTRTGLDQHQVRRWDSWHRWTILAMLAYALLAVLAATERAETSTPPGLPPSTSRHPVGRSTAIRWTVEPTSRSQRVQYDALGWQREPPQAPVAASPSHPHRKDVEPVMHHQSARNPSSRRRRHCGKGDRREQHLES